MLTPRKHLNLDVSVLRLIRVAVGPLVLGDLPKSRWRLLTGQEIAELCGIL